MKLRLEAVLLNAKMPSLSPLERADTLSLLLIELQRRIGLSLMPCLAGDSEQMLKRLIERGASSDEMAAFFSVRIPDYRERVEQVADQFCEECATSLNQLSSSSL